MSRILDIGLVAVIGGALVVGAYAAGRRVEREWWRGQLAERSAAVREVVGRLGAEAEDLDRALLSAVEGTNAKLGDAESKIAALNTRKEPPPVAPVVDAGGSCAPVPTRCLRRGG